MRQPDPDHSAGPRTQRSGTQVSRSKSDQVSIEVRSAGRASDGATRERRSNRERQARKSRGPGTLFELPRRAHRAEPGRSYALTNRDRLRLRPGRGIQNLPDRLSRHELLTTLRREAGGDLLNDARRRLEGLVCAGIVAESVEGPAESSLSLPAQERRSETISLFDRNRQLADGVGWFSPHDQRAAKDGPADDLVLHSSHREAQLDGFARPIRRLSE